MEAVPYDRNSGCLCNHIILTHALNHSVWHALRQERKEIGEGGRFRADVIDLFLE